jgi:hypothetical protein
MRKRKTKRWVVYGVVPLLLPAGPISRAEDRNGCHPWVLFVARATCASGQSRRGAPSCDRSWRSQTADVMQAIRGLGSIVPSYNRYGLPRRASHIWSV